MPSTFRAHTGVQAADRDNPNVFGAHLHRRWINPPADTASV